ncbi:MAG: hypothetical protein MI794_16320 [Pseudomonadales bacterium]|nr:hypothetical protein [Pseudomonadales bacterium]
MTVDALFVPIRIDALIVPQDRAVASPFADFSRLPHFRDGADQNADTAYLSENMLSEPFDEKATRVFRDSGFVLKKGVHLHWALPDTLHKAETQGVIAGFDATPADIELLATGGVPEKLGRALQDAGLSTQPGAEPLIRRQDNDRWSITDPTNGRRWILRLGTAYQDEAPSLRQSDNRPRFRLYSGEVTFHPAPTRWLVTRRVDDQITGQWLIESDWLGDLHDAAAVGVTYPREDTSDGLSYGRLGRTRKRDAPGPDSDGGIHVPNLTAVGYGDVNFATFYPNCHSVFGFHDPDGVRLHRSGAGRISYDVIGWYPEPTQDILSSEALADQLDQLVVHYGFDEDSVTPADSETLRALRCEAIEALTKWRIDTGSAVPSRTLCHARVTIDCDAEQPPERWCHAEQLAPVKVAVGNTATEALSAYLACHTDTHKAHQDGSASIDNADPAEFRRRFEESLESLYLDSLLEQTRSDGRATFLQARHAGEFTSIDGGVIWSLVDASAEGANDTLAEASEPAGHKLNYLNRLQAVCNRHKHELDDTREQLFADWCKYLSLAHPSSMFDRLPEAMRVLDPDRIAWYLETVDLEDIRQRHQDLVDALSRRDEALSDLSRQLASEGVNLELKPVPAPRYWQANEPVILIAGEIAHETKRHGNDGELSCAVHSLSGERLEDALDEAVHKAFERAKDTATGLHSCCEQPWNPFLLEWEVRLHRSVQPEVSTDPSTGVRTRQHYSSTALGDTYRLIPGDADFQLKNPESTPFEPGAHSYAGRSILTPHARLQLRRQIVRQLITRLGPDFDAAHREADIDLNRLEPAQTFHHLQRWYQALPEATRSGRSDTAVVDQLLALYHQVFGDDDSHEYRVLTQSLTGFNDALLMRKNTLQLPVEDPLGFPSEREFAHRIAAGVGNGNRRAAQPWNDFVPLRAGHLEIAALRLIDTFGRTQDLDFAQQEVGGNAHLATTTAMSVDGALDRVHLKPRLTQPARLEMRWLAAESSTGDETEMNALPAVSPICGYLLHNHVDRDVAVYDSKGQPLGALAETGLPGSAQLRWMAAPGESQRAPWDLPNQHLQDVVQHFLDSNGVARLERLERHLNAIQPAHGNANTSMAFLVGRPLAVVRMSLQLELKGLPSHDQSYAAFARILAAGRERRAAVRATEAGIKQLRFPVSIGAHGRQNDGLVALWQEESDSDGRSRLVEACYTEDDPVIELTPGAEPVTLTLLIDPRAPIHATSGIQPVKACHLPTGHYTPALSRLTVWFRVGPILTPPDRIALDLPEQPGFRWAWVENRDGSYEETDELSPAPQGAEYGAEPQLIEGWLKLTPLNDEETT